MIKELLDIFIRKIPSVIYEPLYITGFLGFICCIKSKKIQTNIKIILLAIFLLLISWRIIFYSSMVSKRYFEILIVPFCLLSSYFCVRMNGVSNNNNINSNKGQKKHQYTITLFVLTTLVLLEINKLQRNDFYYSNMIQVYERIKKSMTGFGEGVVFTNLKEEEIRRIKYYIDDSCDIHQIDNYSFICLAKQVSNLLYFKNVYILWKDEIESNILQSSLKPLENNNKENNSKVFTSSTKKTVLSCLLFKTNEDKKDPILISGDKKSNLLDSISDCPYIKEKNDDAICFQGQLIEIMTRDFYPVSADNRIDLSVKIKNIGINQTKIYIGYAFYDINKRFVGGEYYLEGDNETILSVIKTTDNNDGIIVDQMPTTWRKKCSIALDPQDDFSDIPNSNLLNALVANIELSSDGMACISLDRSLNDKLSPGTTIRLQRVSGAYIYKIVQLLDPGESLSHFSSIAKYDSYFFYNSQAISRGVFYVRPIILSYSTNTEDNLIEVLEWKLRY